MRCSGRTNAPSSPRWPVRGLSHWCTCTAAATGPRCTQPWAARAGALPGPVHRPHEHAAGADIRAFTELTAANELDVLRHNADLASRYGAALGQLFAGARPRLTDAAWQAWSRPARP